MKRWHRWGVNSSIRWFGKGEVAATGFIPIYIIGALRQAYAFEVGTARWTSRGQTMSSQDYCLGACEGFIVCDGKAWQVLRESISLHSILAEGQERNKSPSHLLINSALSLRLRWVVKFCSNIPNGHNLCYMSTTLCKVCLTFWMEYFTFAWENKPENVEFKTEESCESIICCLTVMHV